VADHAHIHCSDVGEQRSGSLANRIDAEALTTGDIELIFGIDQWNGRGRYRREPPSVRCNRVSARTMEKFRALRHAGLSSDHHDDVVLRGMFVKE
jgi:hypothetical protein